MRRYDTIVTTEPIDKGWSGDRKYRVTTSNGSVYLLRISEEDKAEKKQRQFAAMSRAAELGIPMCLPVEFGHCPEGVYSLQSWVDGEDAESIMAGFSAEDQYRFGLDAGRILKKLHTIPAPADAEDWSQRFGKKIDRKIKMYNECPLRYPKDEPIFRHIAKSRHLLDGRPQTYQHGDYHIGNMMIHRDGTLYIIDFDRDDWGDPWEEFNRIVWCAQAAPYFATGMVDGYFDSQVSLAFWELLALYICSNTLSSLPWAIPFGEKEIATMQNQASEILSWYDDFRTVIPSWYRHP